MKSNEKTKKIYIILSFSGTMLSHIIKVYTRKQFSHVSIALDKNLDRMYSFGRLTPYNPLYGGFVHEGIDFGTFKRFKNTIAEVYSLEVTKKQYDKIENCIEKMKNSNISYKFNFVGLLGCAFNVRFKQANAFYCAEFLKYLFEQAGIDLGLPELVKPMDFRIPEKMQLEYKGILRFYKNQKV